MIPNPECHDLLMPVSLDRLDEYIHDGELDARQDELDAMEPIGLWLPGDP